MTDLLSTVDGLLIDIDGVLTYGNQVLPGALETMHALCERDVPHCYLTNSTIYCRYSLLDRLRALGFEVEMEQLLTATYAAARYLREQNARSYLPLLLPDAQLEFDGLDVDEEMPEFVVIGDIGAGFNFSRLNRAFRAILNGAQLIALHKKRLWRTENGLFLDAGAFVVALEYASEHNAVVVGKPSERYFQLALDALDLPAERVAMIGDDVEIDVRGAQRMGVRGWLVKTGRFQRGDLARGIWPDQVLNEIGELLGHGARE